VTALSEHPVIYHRGGRRVLRSFQSSLWFSDASAFSACSAVKFKDIVITLVFSDCVVSDCGSARVTS